MEYEIIEKMCRPIVMAKPSVWNFTWWVWTNWRYKGNIVSKEVKDTAQKQAEQAFDGFMLWSKRVALWSTILLLLVVFACNAGVEKGSYPAYNGDQYAPTNMNW